MLRTIEVKLYPTVAQAETLTRWMGVCCWVYNQSLEHRRKCYKRRKANVSYADQTAMLTQWRRRMPELAEVPYEFAKDAMRRVDRGFKAFFRRVKAGENPGYPRFRSRIRYTSIELLSADKYADGRTVRIAKLGHVRSRGPVSEGTQRLLRVLRRASGLYAQILVDDGKKPPRPKKIKTCVGIDVGLNSFATLSTGETIPNPRWSRAAERLVARAHRRVSRCVRGSRNRRKAIRRLQRIHELVAARRRDFCHQHSRRLVERFDVIGFEDLNIRGLARTRMAKSVMGAAWGMFARFLTYKAEEAGKRAVAVDCRGTSQECPDCGAVAKKKLSERQHCCINCGLVLDRDYAAGMVIETRALRAIGAESLLRHPPLRPAVNWSQAGSMMKVD